MKQIALDFAVHHGPENNIESQVHYDDNKAKFNKQCQLVYDALMRGERLTVRSALLKYGIGHLPRRVKDLRDKFHINIQDERMDGGFKEYFLKLT